MKRVQNITNRQLMSAVIVGACRTKQQYCAVHPNASAAAVGSLMMCSTLSCAISAAARVACAAVTEAGPMPALLNATPKSAMYYMADSIVCIVCSLHWLWQPAEAATGAKLRGNSASGNKENRPFSGRR